MKIAVVGSGVAGIVSAYLLQRRHEVTLYEKNDYIGGHTHTIVIEQGQDAGTPVDTGFIVFNEKTYPTFLTFLAQLGVDKHKSSMCFSYYDENTGLAYGSETLDTLFAQRRNLLRPDFWMMVGGILRFNQQTPLSLRRGSLKNLTLGEYLRSRHYNRYFIERYLIPMCAAVWSTPDVRMLDFPMETLARFFLNHGLFAIITHPQWYTVKGGSHAYVKAFLKTFKGRVHLNMPVNSVHRQNDKVMVKLGDGREEAYDKVVLACHADEALKLLGDPSEQERQLLSSWGYCANQTILHTDTTFLPPLAKVWSSWNYQRSAGTGSDAPITLTYHMNRLQNLGARNQYCVTLNPKRVLDQRRVIREMVYTHPVYTPASLASQELIRQINGRLNTYYCGSYLGYGFHEDAVKSAVEMAGHLGITL